jgi:hypothetical protein
MVNTDNLRAGNEEVLAIWFGLLVYECLASLSTIFQLCHDDDKLYWYRKLVYQKTISSLPNVNDNLV